MPYLDPENLTQAERKRIRRWLDANGCRDHVALLPIVIAGSHAHYKAVCRQGRINRSPGAGGPKIITDPTGWKVLIGRPRTIRIRIPLQDVP